MKYAEFKKTLSGAIQAGSHTWLEIPSLAQSAGIYRFLNIFTGSIITVMIDKDSNITTIEAEK